jgi:hypothetical protein
VTPDELRAIGVKLYGDQWQTPMSKALPCSTRTIRYWLSGKRKIHPKIEVRISSRPCDWMDAFISSIPDLLKDFRTLWAESLSFSTAIVVMVMGVPFS